MLEKTVLIVDDDEDILNLYKHFLKEVASEIFIFECPEKALELIKFKKVDMIITDILMPGMNGIEFTKFVHEKFPGLPVLVCSEGGNSEARDIVASIVMNKAISFGATYALKKPFHKKELINVVQKILEGNIEDLKNDAS